MSNIGNSYTEMVITIATADGENVQTRVFRMEFESLDDALNYIDTSNEPTGLLNVQEMGI